MADWPFLVNPIDSSVHLSTLHSCSVITCGLGGAASAAWPTANMAFYVPFRIERPLLIRKLFWTNGSATSGAVDAGIYDEAGTRLISTASTAQTGASVPQSVNTTDITIGPGLFYFALALDNTTGTTQRLAIGGLAQEGLRAIGMAQQATAFPLPATATFASMATSYVPLVGAVAEVVAT